MATQQPDASPNLMDIWLNDENEEVMAHQLEADRQSLDRGTSPEHSPPQDFAGDGWLTPHAFSDYSHTDGDFGVRTPSSGDSPAVPPPASAAKPASPSSAPVASISGDLPVSKTNYDTMEKRMQEFATSTKSLSEQLTAQVKANEQLRVDLDEMRAKAEATEKRMDAHGELHKSHNIAISGWQGHLDSTKQSLELKLEASFGRLQPSTITGSPLPTAGTPQAAVPVAASEAPAQAVNTNSANTVEAPRAKIAALEKQVIMLENGIPDTRFVLRMAAPMIEASLDEAKFKEYQELTSIEQLKRMVQSKNPDGEGMDEEDVARYCEVVREHSMYDVDVVKDFVDVLKRACVDSEQLRALEEMRTRAADDSKRIDELSATVKNLRTDLSAANVDRDAAKRRLDEQNATSDELRDKLEAFMIDEKASVQRIESDVARLSTNLEKNLEEQQAVNGDLDTRIVTSKYRFMGDDLLRIKAQLDAQGLNAGAKMWSRIQRVEDRIGMRGSTGVPVSAKAQLNALSQEVRKLNGTTEALRDELNAVKRSQLATRADELVQLRTGTPSSAAEVEGVQWSLHPDLAVAYGGTIICSDCDTECEYYAISDCNHISCAICTIKHRAIDKQHTCLLCHDVSAQVIVTGGGFSSFDTEDSTDTDRVHYFGIKYATADAYSCCKEQMHSYGFACPMPYCDSTWPSHSELIEHHHAEHGYQLCYACLAGKDIFTHEQRFFNEHDLQRHMMKEHKWCESCDKWIYSEEKYNSEDDHSCAILF